MSLSFGISPLFLLPCLIAAAALAFWVYTNTVPRVSGARKYALAFLRFSSLFLVLFLLFEPIIRNMARTERPPVLAVLVDDSQSLTVYDGGAAGDSAALPSLVRQALGGFPEQSIPGEVRYYRFSDATHPVDAGSSRLADSLTFAGDRTNISQALDFVRENLREDNLQGVLIFSDGQFNTGRNPMYLAERYPVPIHTVVLGDTTRQRDLQIRRITTNDLAYVGDELPIQASVLSEDFAGERVTVSLFEDGVLLESINLDLPAGTAEIPVDLFHVPETPGLHRYSISVTNLPGEVTLRNNTQSFAVRVIENKKRILFLAAAPEPDVSAIRQLLADDTDLDVDPYVQKSRTAFYGNKTLDSLDSYDAVVLVGYPGRASSLDVGRRVADQIESGLPALFILSTHTDLRLYNELFADLLPVQPRVFRVNLIESMFTPTPQGAQHPLLQIPDLIPAYWDMLPPLVFNDSRWQAAPDARTLATHTVRGIPLDDPLLVIQSRNQRRSAALLGAETWRWNNLPEDLDAAANVWPTLFSNVLQWITTLEDDRPVRVAPTEDLFGGGSPIQFTGQVYDESLNPVDGASIEVEVIAADSIRYPFTMKPAGNGRYVLDIGALPEGTYQYAARATQNDRELGADQGSFAVGSLTLEFKETRADGQLMRLLAQRSGGAVFDTDNLSTVSTHLAGSDTFRPIFFEERIETELWHRYIFLFTILALLTTEWFFRKRSGMV